MTVDEVVLLKKYYGKAKSYFEWGTGGSTVLADMYENIQDIYSVESDQQWIDNVGSFLKNNKTTFYYIDINAGEWGSPKDRSKIDNWPNYSNSVASPGKLFDLVLIDGRFRVACAAMAYHYLTDSGVLLVHDYTHDRKYYHVIEELYAITERANNLVVLEKREKLEAKAEALYNEYKLKQE